MGFEVNTQQRIESLFRNAQAVITGDHFVYTSGKHGNDYVNKDALYPDPFVIEELCKFLAKHFIFGGRRYDVVVAPEKGGIILSQWVAYHSRKALGNLAGRSEEQVIQAVYAEKKENSLLRPSEQQEVRGLLREVDDRLLFDRRIKVGEELLIRTAGFHFKRGYEKFVRGKRVLIVEDILNTGGSVKAVVDAVRAVDGNIVAVGALCSRGGVTSEMIGNVPEIVSLLNVNMVMHDATEQNPCPICLAGLIPINEKLGKGKEYMDAKRAAAQVE